MSIKPTAKGMKLFLSKIKPTLKDRVKRVEKGLRKVKQVQEVKYIDNEVAATFANDAAIYTINNIAQGDDVDQRDGDTISLRHLEVNLLITWNSAATSTDTVRMVILKDRQADGAVPLQAELFDGTTLGCIEHFNDVYDSRFIILLDKVINNPFPSTAKNKTQTVRYRMKLRGKAKFIGTGSAITDVGQGSVFICTTGNQTVASGLSATASVYSRLKYVG